MVVKRGLLARIWKKTGLLAVTWRDKAGYGTAGVHEVECRLRVCIDGAFRVQSMFHKADALGAPELGILWGVGELTRAKPL